MFGIIMKKGMIVQKILLLDNELAKEGFDVTGAIKRPDILLDAAEDHLRLLQDEIRGETK